MILVSYPLSCRFYWPLYIGNNCPTTTLQDPPATFIFWLLRLDNNVRTTLGLVPVDPEVTGTAAVDETAPLAKLLAGVSTQEAVPGNDRHDVLVRRHGLGP